MVVSGKVRTCQATLEHVIVCILGMLMDETACYLENLLSRDDVEKFLAAQRKESVVLG